MRHLSAKALSLALILNYSCPDLSALAARFVDLSSSWSEKYVNTLSDKGVIGASKDGKFNPDQPIKRAELAAWLVKVLGIQNQPISDTPSFSDVKPTDWFYKPVEIIRQNNYISGYADGFRPNQYIQRGEVLVIIARTLNLKAPNETTISQLLSKYTDGDKVPDWARLGVAEVAETKILINHPDAMVIDATSIAKRGDTAALLYNLESYLAKQHIAKATHPSSPAAAQAATPPTAPKTQIAQVPKSDQSQVPYTPYNAPATDTAGAASQNYGGQQYIPPNNNQGPPQNSQPPYQGQQQYGQPGGYQAPPQTGYAQGGYQQQQSGYGAQGAPYGQPPAGYLQGSVAVVSAGTHFQATLKNTIDSGSTQPGEEVTATLSSPLYANGVEAVPAGSKLIGQVTNVVSAKRFRFGANGKIDIRFTAIETPDGRRFPLSASVDSNQLKLVGGSTGGRVGKSALAVGAGAAGGALFGTALGPIVGATSYGNVGRSVGMGAIFGTALGAGVGVIGAGVRKGSEVKIVSGTQMPVQLDESFQVTTGQPPPPSYGSYPPPVRQPSGYYPNQQ